MTIVRVGTNKKFAQGWELAFGKGSGRAAAKPSAAKKSKLKAAPPKKTKKGAKAHR